jgi:hypothetical protein
MTKVNPQSAAQDIADLDDDDMPSEYNFTGNGVRGKYFKAIQEHGYSITVHHDDGTSTTKHISPSEVMEQNRQRELLKAFNNPTASAQNHTWTGDRVAGDKFTGDKVMGNKVQIGTVQGDAVAGNKIVNAQDLTQAAQDIKALFDQLAIDYPQDDDFTRAGRAVGGIKNNPNLKQRLINAARESSFTAVEKAIEAVVENPAVGIIVAGVKGFIDAEG